MALNNVYMIWFYEKWVSLQALNLKKYEIVLECLNESLEFWIKLDLEFEYRLWILQFGPWILMQCLESTLHIMNKCNDQTYKET